MCTAGASHTTHLLINGWTADTLTGIIGTEPVADNQYMKSFLDAYLQLLDVSQNKNGIVLNVLKEK